MTSLGAHRAWARAKRDGIEGHFPGVCRKCPTPIAANDLMYPAVGGGFVHEDCLEEESDET